MEMTKAEKAFAYTQVKALFDLNAAQRDRLDASPDLDNILKLAHEKNWASLEVVMNNNDYFAS